MNGKHLIMGVMFGLLALTSWAGVVNTLVIKYADETSVKVLLKEDVQGTFADGNLTFSGENTAVTVKQSDIQSFAFEYDESSAVEGVQAEAGTVSVSNGVITISNLPENSLVTIYNAAGQLVAKYKGADSVVTEPLSVGLYVVTINGKSIKLVVK